MSGGAPAQVVQKSELERRVVVGKWEAVNIEVGRAGRIGSAIRKENMLMLAIAVVWDR